MTRPSHLLEQALQDRITWLSTTLRPSTAAQYQHTVRHFLRFLWRAYPELRRLDELRRDPHLLGWLEHLWRRRKSSGAPLRPCTRAGEIIRLRKLLELLADHPFPPPFGLLLSEDLPPAEHTLPRPLTSEDDARLCAHLHSRQDWQAQALLLTRLTGLRIGETADLAADCLWHLGGDDWALHVPLGKLHSERWTPVGPEVRDLVARLRFLATLPPTGPPEFLLPRPKSRAVLCNDLRAALGEACAAAGINRHIVPHQLRHTYATEMLRAGVSLPALMKLLGHRNANMTLRYVEITQTDLQREFHGAVRNPRYRIPLPASLPGPQPEMPDAQAVLRQMGCAIAALDLFGSREGQQPAKPLQLLLRRLRRIRARFEKWASGGLGEK